MWGKRVSPFHFFKTRLVVKLRRWGGKNKWDNAERNLCRAWHGKKKLFLERLCNPR